MLFSIDTLHIQAKIGTTWYYYVFHKNNVGIFIEMHFRKVREVLKSAV